MRDGAFRLIGREAKLDCKTSPVAEEPKLILTDQRAVLHMRRAIAA